MCFSGFTQGDVGAALGRTFHDFSQTTISRFEALNLSFKNMCKIKEFLQQWLRDQENMSNNVTSTSFAGRISPTEKLSLKRRKKRTTIEDSTRDLLEQHFLTNSKPSSQEIGDLADQYNLEKSVVRVWFCNRRQKEKRAHPCGSTISIQPANPMFSGNFMQAQASSQVVPPAYVVVPNSTMSTTGTVNTGGLSTESKIPTTGSSPVNADLEKHLASARGLTLKNFASPPLIFNNG